MTNARPTLRGALALALGLGVLTVLVLRLLPAPELSVDSRPAGVVDELHVDFAEDDDGRLVAAIQVQLVSVAGATVAGVQVRIAPSAVGPGVDPVPGFRGVVGGNLQTAREFQRLAEVGGLELHTQRLDGPSAVETSRAVTVAATGRLAERRRLVDGRLDYSARSEPLPVRLSLVGEVVGDGRWQTAVHVGGTARLIVEFEASSDGGGRLLDIRQPPGHEPSESALTIEELSS